MLTSLDVTNDMTVTESNTILVLKALWPAETPTTVVIRSLPLKGLLAV